MLPFPNMNFVPLDILTAAEQNMLVQNILSLSNGSGIANGAITPRTLSSQAVVDTNGWADYGQFWFRQIPIPQVVLQAGQILGVINNIDPPVGATTQQMSRVVYSATGITARIIVAMIDNFRTLQFVNTFTGVSTQGGNPDSFLNMTVPK